MIIDVQPGCLQRTLCALPPGEEPILIRLAPGEYREKCVLARKNVTLCGAGADRTRIVFGDGARDVIDDGTRRRTFRTAALRIDAENVTLSGLTIENDAAPRERAGQAIALYADGDGLLCTDCRLLSFQDTLFTAPLPQKEMEPGGFIGPKQFAARTPQRQTYRRCLIAGDVDFIFGGAAAWFEDCEIRSVDGREDRRAPYVGYACAPSTPKGQKFGYVFVRCRFTHERLDAGSVYIARPWREHAKALLEDCELGAHIHPKGFDDWGKTHAHETVCFVECGSFGPGARGERAPFAKRAEHAGVSYEEFMRSMDAADKPL